MMHRDSRRARALPRRIALAALLGAAPLAGTALAPTPAHAQWSTTYEQFYLPGDFNWQFRRNYPAADRLFNAFDYGHAILYEELYTRPNAPASRLEEREYDFITRKLLVSPPPIPLEEGAIEIAYVKLAPEAKMMFEWAHVLHRQIYDILADERLPDARKDAKIEELLRYYKSRRDLAFSSRPKSMELMEGQYYSMAFRERYPKFNGLIWAYHWLQVGLYEPLLVGRSLDERQTGVLAAVTRFRQMLERAPDNMPRLMPMTAAVAPRFAERYPEAAIIFDNLHGMHDVISDILASPKVPRDRKREEILRAAARYRDDSSYVMTVAEWRDMSRMMGIENMGGPAVGMVAALPTPTVPLGATHEEAMRAGGHGAHGAHGAGQGNGAAAPAAGHDAHGQHGQHGQQPTPPAQQQMHHGQHAPQPTRADSAAPTAPATQAAPAPADPHAGHRTTPAAAPAAKPAATKPAAAKPAATKPAAKKPAAKPAARTAPRRPAPARPDSQPKKPAEHHHHPPGAR